MASTEEDSMFPPYQLWKPPSDLDLHLPRILCLHGGGTNARIFRTQCRVLRAHMGSFFRFVFVDAPYVSKPGPDVESVYADWGPFRSWRRPGYVPGNGLVASSADRGEIESIEKCLTRAMDKDDKSGATGQWVALLGFSQGANLAASLLLRQQNQKEKGRSEIDRLEDSLPFRNSFHFAVLLAGRAPILLMEPDTADPLMADPAAQSFLRLPTIHVHGLKDAGISMHRDLLRCCDKDKARVVEWDGDHRVPIKSNDVVALVIAILDVAKQTGILI